MVPLWKSSALSDKKFLTENRDTPSLPQLLPPLIHEFFRYLKLVKHYGLPLGKFSALRDKKFSTENLDTAPHLIHKDFDYRKFSETQHRRVPLRKSSALWDKKCLREKRDTPSLLPPAPPSHPWTFSIPEISEPLRVSPSKIFGSVRQKNFDGKSWYSSPSYP